MTTNENSPLLSKNSDASPPQYVPLPSNENENKKLFDLMASKNWSEANDLLENKDGQRTPQEIQNLLVYQDEEGCTALNSDNFGDPDNMPPDALILKMIEIGGIKLIRIATNNGFTILHNVCYWGASPRVILKVIAIGKKEMVTKTTNDVGCTPLHCILEKYKNETYMEVFHKLVEVGSADILNLKDNDGDTPLHLHLNRIIHRSK
jgi:hypothetical protein